VRIRAPPAPRSRSRTCRAPISSWPPRSKTAWPLPAGDAFEVRYALRATLAPGDYYLVVALEDRSGGGIAYFDYVEGAHYFSTAWRRRVHGRFLPPIAQRIDALPTGPQGRRWRMSTNKIQDPHVASHEGDMNSRDYWDSRFRSDWDALGGEEQSRFFRAPGGGCDAGLVPRARRARPPHAVRLGLRGRRGTEVLADALNVVGDRHRISPPRRSRSRSSAIRAPRSLPPTC
jgi:hypothetical protein